jgi:hypothetical protein
MELKSGTAICERSLVSAFRGNVVTLRSALADAFFFVAYRSFVAAVVTRAVLIASVFVLAFANHASAQDSLRSTSAHFSMQLLWRSFPIHMDF